MALSATAWLAIALACAAAFGLLWGTWFLPDDLSALEEPPLRGVRQAHRQAALQSSPLLRIIWPLIRVGAYYAARLPIAAWRERQSVTLRVAGEPLGLSPDEFVGLLFASIVLSSLSALGFSQIGDLGLGVVLLGILLGFILPLLWLRDRADLRMRSINRGLPQALDLIVLSMGAGLDFIGAVRHVVEKWSDKRDPLCEELSRFLHELGLGKTRREALEDFAYRAPTGLVRAFVSNAILAEQRGTPLVETLHIQAEVARTRRFQMAEKVAGRANVVLLLPLMFIFSSTVLIMFGSLIVRGLRGQLF